MLHSDGGVSDPLVIAAALPHDPIEGTQNRHEELRGQCGEKVPDTVVELTETKVSGVTVKEFPTVS